MANKVQVFSALSPPKSGRSVRACPGAPGGAPPWPWPRPDPAACASPSARAALTSSTVARNCRCRTWAAGFARAGRRSTRTPCFPSGQKRGARSVISESVNERKELRSSRGGERRRIQDVVLDVSFPICAPRDPRMLGSLNSSREFQISSYCDLFERWSSIETRYILVDKQECAVICVDDFV